jgi:hypothetical protein
VRESAGTDGIQSLQTVSANAEVSVFTIDGMQVANGQGMNTLEKLGKGLYVVKVKDGDKTQTVRFARK